MRRGRTISGVIAVVAALAFAAPALAAGHSAVDEGYPCATQPPAAPNGGTQGATSCTPSPSKAAPAARPQKGTAGVQKVVERRPAPVQAVSHAATLPFTGLQLGLFSLVGAALIGGGLLLRASSRTGGDR